MEEIKRKNIGRGGDEEVERRRREKRESNEVEATGNKMVGEKLSTSA